MKLIRVKRGTRKEAGVSNTQQALLRFRGSARRGQEQGICGQDGLRTLQGVQPLLVALGAGTRRNMAVCGPPIYPQASRGLLGGPSAFIRTSGGATWGQRLTCSS